MCSAVRYNCVVLTLPYEASARRYTLACFCTANQFKMSVSQPRAAFCKALNLLLSRGMGKFDDMVNLAFW